MDHMLKQNIIKTCLKQGGGAQAGARKIMLDVDVFLSSRTRPAGDSPKKCGGRVRAWASWLRSSGSGSIGSS